MTGTVDEKRVASIARVAHEVNRAYCESKGDRSLMPWDEAPDWQRDSVIAGVHLLLENPDLTPEQSHEAWMERKLAEGWKRGAIKDPEARTHPALKPWDALPHEQRIKDHLFVAVVRACHAG